MKWAKEKLDLTWLYKPEYEILLPFWEERSTCCTSIWTSEENCFGFRQTCYRDKGRGTTTQHIKFIVRQNDKKLQVEIYNPRTYCTSTALLPLDNLPPSPRQFQKLVFAEAKGDGNTLSASKTNLRETWKGFVATMEKLPVLEHGQLHTELGAYEE